MSKQLLQEAKRYSVFQIKNVNPKSKDKGRSVYLTSSIYTKENILSKIRSMQDSSTGRGGTKEIGADIQAAGKEYEEKFQVTQHASGLSKEQADTKMGMLVKKDPKVYNKEMPVPNKKK